jgi:hypothetical protein
MGSEATVSRVVNKILQLWRPYQWSQAEETEWIDTLTVEISGFPDQVLERAISEMIRKRDDRRTPLPAEVIAACVEAKRWLDVENGQKILPTITDDGFGSKYPEHADSRYRLADDLICGRMGSPEIGRQAAKDGYWIGQLHDFCRMHKRLPSPNEIAALKRAGREVDDVFAGYVPDGGWASKTALWAIETVAETRQKLIDLVEGRWVRPDPPRVDRVLHGVVG